jgi:hypothetical protein
MPRPCQLSHPLSPDSCRICHWCMDGTAKGAAYRKLWGEDEPATLAGMAASFIGAVASHVMSGGAKAPPEELASRLAVCADCPERVTHAGRADSCRKCGCNLPLKASWASQRCPLGLW